MKQHLRKKTDFHLFIENKKAVSRQLFVIINRENLIISFSKIHQLIQEP